MNKAAEILKSVRYSLYLIFHPFKGFWDLKKEKRGSIGAAVTIIFLLVLVYITRLQFTGYLFNSNKTEEVNLFSQISSVILMFLLWCVSNWCITTLVDGEGSFKDIVITSAFAMTPLILIQFPLALFSNVIVLDESSFYTLFDSLSIIWTCLLLLIGIMTVHQFSMRKTIGTIFIALAGMVVIVFLFILLFALVQQIINFAVLFFKELAVRNGW